MTQTGMFLEGSRAHHFLEYRRQAGVALPRLREALRAALAARAPGADPEGLALVVAFGPELWRELAEPGAVPADLRPFQALAGRDGRAAPATPRDLLVWVHGPARDEVFARALAVDGALRASFALELEEEGFQFRDSRDLTGFVDGSANPQGQERLEVALVPAGQPGAGGSVVLAQRWLHDLASFLALSQAEQEAVIGRTKPDSLELDDAHKPADSHVARAEAEEDGVELAIYRRSAPFGRVREHGLYFLAFACALRRFDVILARMFGLSEDEIRDRLTDFSRPVTGCYLFAPSAADLAAACRPR